MLGLQHGECSHPVVVEGFVAAACGAIPISRGGGGGRGWEDAKATTQTPIQSFLLFKGWGFYGFREIKLRQE